jgi:hypothetical protein
MSVRDRPREERGMDTNAIGSNGNGSTQAIEIYRPSAMAAYEPRNLQEALELAKMFADSKLVPNVQTQSKAMIIMATGAELGISATAALRSIYVVGDKPSLSAQLKLALCLRSKLCKHFKEIESNDDRAFFETWRVGDDKPIAQTFTIEDARKMLGDSRVDDKNGNWFKVRRRMLRWRCIGELADRVYPELMLGLATTEEMIDENVVDMRSAGPMQLDPGLLGAVTTVTTIAEREKEERKEERRADANAAESIEAAFERWKNILNSAATTTECDKVATEAQKRFDKGDPNRERAKEMVGAAKERLRTAHLKKPAEQQQTLPTAPSAPAEPQRERVVGEDDDR